LQPARAVNPRRLLDLHRDVPEEDRQQPHREAEVDADIHHDQPDRRARETDAREQRGERDNPGDDRHEARAEDVELDVLLERDLVASEGICRGNADACRDDHRHRCDEERMLERRQSGLIASKRVSVVTKVAEARPDRWQRLGLDERLKRRQGNPEHREHDDTRE